MENLTKKHTNACYAVIFTQTCINENLLPKFTNFKLYDQAVRQSEQTLSFRRHLLTVEIKKKKRILEELNQKIDEASKAYQELDISAALRRRTDCALSDLAQTHEQAVRTSILRKLSSLYGGQIFLPEQRDSFVNLSSHILTEDEKDFLNLGLNCRIYSKHNQQDKKAELELLYEQICGYHKDGKLQVNPDIQEQLLAEGTRTRGTTKSSIITPRLREAATRLRENQNIVIRRADKSSIFVILDHSDYLSKVNIILSDVSKFQRLRKNPIEQQKRDLNALIDAANADADGVKFCKITGEFSPGYFYGNPKTHKPGAPVRPIISQIPTPAYEVAKRLNSIISPYVPNVYSLKSSDEFVEILRVRQRQGTLASLDASSLFTNVPVDATIDVILCNVYEHDSIPAPRLPRAVLKRMLEICTKDTAFRCPRGHLYRQIDGVAMGSPLGVLFAETYMAHIESKALDSLNVKPHTYCRYIDDIFVDVQDEDQLHNVKAALEEQSVLRFTVEPSISHRIPFLDVQIDATDGPFITTVYRKPTDTCHCLRGDSECPDKYKESVIRAHINRAIKHCSSWPLLHQELQRIKQILVNNKYTVTDIDSHIRRQLHKHFSRPAPVTNEHSPTQVDGAVGTQGDSTAGTPVDSAADPQTGTQVIKLFYKGNMSSAYKKDEKVLRDIVHRNCLPVAPYGEIKLFVYYQTPSTSKLVMRNNTSRDTSDLKATNVIYEFQCPIGDCARRSNSSYIGYTTTTLSRRITMHLQNGAPEKHVRTAHNTRLTRSMMEDNTNIIARCQKKKKLIVLEAVYIRDRDPAINRQMDMRGTLSLYDGRPLAPRV